MLGGNTSAQYTSAAGMDFSVEYAMKNMGVQIGYQALGLNAKSTDSTFNNSKITGFISGIMTQVSYMF